MTASSGDLNSLQTDKTALTSLLEPDSSRGWYGHYYGPDVYVFDSFPPSYFIQGGVAQLPYYSDANQVFSYVTYDIPADHPIYGDSITFEMDIKNPKDFYHSGWDVTMDIKGQGHVEGALERLALVGFVADDIYTPYTQFHVGNAVHNGLSQLVYDFEDFKTIRLVLRNNRASLFLNAKLLYSFTYTDADKIGWIKNIEFGGKGFPACTRVKLYNSYTGKVILSENFNTDGQSTIIYH